MLREPEQNTNRREFITIDVLNSLQKEFPDVYGPNTWFLDREGLSPNEIHLALHSADDTGVPTPFALFLEEDYLKYSNDPEYFGRNDLKGAGVLVHAPHIGACTNLPPESQFYGTNPCGNVYPQGLGDRVNVLFLDKSTESPRHLSAFDQFRQKLSSRRQPFNPLFARVYSLFTYEEEMRSAGVVPFDWIGKAFRACSSDRRRSGSHMSNSTLLQLLLLRSDPDYILAQEIESGRFSAANMREYIAELAKELNGPNGTIFSSLLYGIEKRDPFIQAQICHTILLCKALNGNGHPDEIILNKASLMQTKLSGLS